MPVQLRNPAAVRRLAGDRLIDHLAVNRADALGVLGEDGAGLLDRFRGGSESRVDHAYLCGMNGGLGAEAERHGGGYCLF
jgi:hypothetical protein